MTARLVALGVLLGTVGIFGASVCDAQAPAVPVPPVVPPGPTINAPPDYLIGADDVISIDVLIHPPGGGPMQRDPLMSGDVVIRPDGKFSLPLLKEVEAAGLTPEQLRLKVEELALVYAKMPVV